jgi:hypothetical protein
MKIYTFQGSDVIDVIQNQPLPGNPVFADLIFRPRRNLAPSVVAGCGAYAICFQNSLLYVGQYRGTIGAPFGGHVVRERWTKHLATLTLRGRRVSVPNQTITELSSRYRDHPAVAGILDADRKVVSKDKGCISSLNRIRFAMQHWDDAFADFNSGVLNRFTFLYGQIQPYAVSEDWIRGAVSDLERDLVARLQPPCNGNVPAERARHHTLEQTRQAIEAALSRLAPGA